ncbi:enoyl-CoA hydratase/carnithine racemase [Nocardia kruczakiae]|uniref:Enoyl-CoA hydratase/carnithine racemase n=1 Tax=Nocardia kruczakiae TaxID=261477 RepID=A0ABU1X9T0_9NOCA|nr:enoyl-CoA hydratase-related protein [Nocardia kruczakiae]MDR7167294.1 enoyl-CoA hydratase/carnithine racemase [Nocardia kruczakiae]
MSAQLPLLLERTDKVARLTFNRPERLNALTTEMMNAAAAFVEQQSADSGVRVFVLTGAGRAFSAGADLTGHGNDDPGMLPIDAANRLTRALRAAPQPIVAAVNGAAAGVGCSFALASDLVVACESADFLLAFADIGLMPDGGATALIPALIGYARATRMAMLAERIPARVAAEWGLIGHVVADTEFDSEVELIVTRLATGPTAAYTRTKHAFNATALAQLETALEIERDGQSALFDTADLAEGVTAFKAKRRPKFVGK